MKKALWLQTTLISAITLSTLNFPGNVPPGQAQTLISTNKIQYVSPVNQEKPGEPIGRRKGGGSRSSCKNYASLTALVPTTNSGNKDIVWGQSTSPNPTFWFFVPDKLTTKSPIEFVIQDDADNYIYHTKFNPPETPAGIINLAVQPKTPLVAGKNYRWTFSIYCDPEKPSSSVYVRGSMTQVALNSTLQKQLETAQTPLDKAAIFAKNGIWYNALTTLGEEIQRNKRKNSEITSAWNELLKQANLENSTSAPIVPCCTPQNAPN
ncbi:MULTISPECIES: DUF928 domain-containing protein [Calothrix]|uniref:DUF928 domain-containing protein n=2 Tax=Calothrix TaxID=1186 RepID=A0ABR8A4Z5_9CYAN|nr:MULTISPECIES: DUF928 domain-containing protein [Calothrix]MBD2194659.1 DUF928 domain-containing protein [Calothrix parietina FACHB-288]MBD2229913.1 DUF928 domain-containing protein [Calothrix anomala FACHB-343]